MKSAWSPIYIAERSDIHRHAPLKYAPQLQVWKRAASRESARQRLYGWSKNRDLWEQKKTPTAFDEKFCAVKERFEDNPDKIRDDIKSEMTTHYGYASKRRAL